jgi:hypothetical protein
VIYVDTGNDTWEWLCNVCFSEWIDSLIRPGVKPASADTPTPSPALFDGDTVTIDGIAFEF